jgi:hypothetical protein
MGKYVVSFLLKRETTMFETFWSQREDVCLGENNGWYVGAQDIQKFFAAKDQHTRRVRDLLTELYPQQAEGKTPEELYGIGILEDRTITNCVLEIAQDGATAKGMWCEFASVTDVSVKGPLSHWVMGYYAADFIREDGGWKIWHLQHLRMVDSPCSQNWSAKENSYPDLPEFSSLAEETFATPTVETELAHLYHADRPFEKTPRIPEPYDTFSETFSYGL